jgi:hypothetical protein
MFSSLFSLIPLPHQQIDELPTKLMHIEITLNSPLGLPLIMRVWEKDTAGIGIEETPFLYCLPSRLGLISGGN